MMNRRLVNLVVANYKSNMYALHRIDASKHLFYPSTAEAEAAQARKNNNNNNGGGGGGGKIGKLRRLPAPITGFESSPTTDTRGWHTRPGDDMFVLLHGPCGRGGEAGRILHANGAGHVGLHDADSRSVICVPSLGEPKGFRPIPFAIAAADDGDGAGEESLYVMRSVPVRPMYHNRQCSLNFEVLDLDGDGGGGSRRSYFLDRPRNNLRWHPLPAPPIVGGRFGSSAVLDGGRVICVSCRGFQGTGTGTFCFDTASREWRRSGEWALPFDGGRAEHVPELETWMGFSPDHPYHLCSADLSGIAAAADAGMAPGDGPALQHVWEDFTPPPATETTLMLNERFPGIVRSMTVEWVPQQLHLVNLGSGRLCIAKVFQGMETVSLSCYFDDHQEPKGLPLTVLVGVEVIRGGGGGLRMVKHKSRRFVFPGNRLGWVL